MFRTIPEFDLYEMDLNKVIRHKETKNIKSPHRGGSNVRLYKDGKELSRKIDKLFDATFPELVKGVVLHPYTKYRITESGEVYSMYEAKVLAPVVNATGYLTVNLVVGDTKLAKSELVHRLVAKAYLGNSDLEVNHKDGNKTNNSIDNLEWVTGSENVYHAVATGLYATKMRQCKLTKDGVEQVFASIKDASDYLQVSPGALRLAMLKNYKGEKPSRGNVGAYTCKGYIPEYVAGDEPVEYNTHLINNN